MIRNYIDKTKISTSHLGFGTSYLHHIFSQKKRIKILETVFENAITHFDTSPYYGNNLAELDLGKKWFSFN